MTSASLRAGAKHQLTALGYNAFALPDIFLEIDAIVGDMPTCISPLWVSSLLFELGKGRI